MDFGEFLESYLAGWEKAVEVKDTDANRQTRDAVLFIWEEWEKSQIIKPPNTKEALENFHKMIKSIGN